LTTAQLQPIISEAIAGWGAAGASAVQVQALQDATYQISTLPPSELGSTTGNVVTISPAAAGASWFVDPTPADNLEFSQIVAPTEFDATPGSPAYGEVDLLTVVSHEMGHVLGLPDFANAAFPYDVMDISIATGVRRIPQASDLQGLQPAASVVPPASISPASTVPGPITVATSASSSGTVTSPTTTTAAPATAPVAQPLLLSSPSSPLGPLVDGEFDQGAGDLAGWSTSDSLYVTVNSSNQAVIAESPTDTEVDLYQDFTLPQGARYLSFTVDGFTFDHSVPSGVTPDAFGVSLLDSSTQKPLVATVDGLTDSYFIEDIVPGASGEAASGVTVTPGTVAGTERITLDVSALQGQAAYLLFRFLGGSDASQLNGSVTISDVTVSSATTTTMLSSSVNPTDYGEAVTFTATVSTSAAGSAPPGGTVTFYDGQAVLGTGTLSGGVATLTTTTLSAGNHFLTADYGGSNDYLSSSTPVALEQVVNPAVLTVTATNASKVYGTPNPAFAVTYAGFVNGQDPTALGGSLTFMTAATAGSDVGSYAVTPGGLMLSNYAITFASGTLSITPAPLSVTVADATRTYGTANPAFSGTVTGILNSDPITASYGTAATQASGIGTYAIGATLSDAGTGNLGDYTVTVTPGTLTITPASLTVTANKATKVYGAANPPFSDTVTGFVNGDSPGVVSGTASLTTTATTSSGVGNYTIIAALGSLSAANYTFTFVNGTLSITPAALTITANNQSMVYGSPLPGLTATFSGFVNGDTSASLTTPPTLRTTATSGSPVGTYAITAGGAADPNYSISYVNGTLTVTPAPLLIIADNKSKVYGAPLPALTASYSGFVNGDTPASLAAAPTLTTTATASSHAGGYAITAGGAVDPDYSISYVGGTLTVTTAALTITANNQTMVYGGTMPALTASFAGLVNGDTPAAISGLTLSTVAATSHAGSYAITAAGASDPDYTISYVNGTLAITPAPLTITADNQTKVYGAALPTLTASYSGFVNGDTAASLTTAPALSTAATASSHVQTGGYAVTVGGAIDPDYSISYVAGKLTVSPAPLTITADSKSMTYGGTLPVLTASYSGLVNGDTPAAIAGLKLSTVAASKHAGNYPITPSGATDPDYTITLVNGTLTITPAPLTITANNQTMVYGGTLPTLTASYTGLVNGDTPASLPTPPTLSTVPATSHAGSYAITAGGAGDPDYTIGYVNGTLTITPATLTVTADNKTKVFGQANPTLTASYSGFVNGDTTAVLIGSPSLATRAGQYSLVGSYPITAGVGSLSAHDYVFLFRNGTLTINKDGTVTSLASSAPGNAAPYGQAVTFTASVAAAAPGSGTPTGLVDFFDATTNTDLGTATLQVVNGVDQATLTTAHLGVGPNAITATYRGDASFLSSTTSSPLVQQMRAGIILLDSTAAGALTLTGNAQAVVNGGAVVVDSSSPTAVAVRGNGKITAPLYDLTVTSGVSTTGSSKVVGPIQRGQAPTADPLASLAPPDPSSLPVRSTSTLYLTGTQVVTLNPGVYVGGIQISGQASVVLNPGIYYMKGGGFSVSGQASVTDLGKGVLIYNAPGSAADVISISGTGSVNLSALTSGPYQGITIFQDRTSAAPISITGNGKMDITGTIYAAYARLNLTGNGGVDASGNPLDTIGSLLIADSLQISGNGTFKIDANP
jgi:hypothetical protein